VNNDSYKTIAGPSSGVFRDRGSRFIGEAFPVADEAEVKKILEKKRKEYHDARHHCYAYIIGPDQSLWRAVDDGEPSGTAGKPILGQIKSADITNVLIVVTRYFGGTLLGVSGLINAYRNAAREAIKAATIEDRFIYDHYRIVFPYSSMNDIMTILKEEDASQKNHSFGTECMMMISFRKSLNSRIMGRIDRLPEVITEFLYSG